MEAWSSVPAGGGDLAAQPTQHLQRPQAASPPCSEQAPPSPPDSARNVAANAPVRASSRWAQTHSPATPREASEPREAASDDDHDLEWIDWSADDVGNWVDALCGDAQGAPFRQHKIDGPTLLELTENDLQTILGVANSLNRSKIMGHLRVFQIRRERLMQQVSRRRQQQQFASQNGFASGLANGNVPGLPRPSSKRKGGTSSVGYPTSQNGSETFGTQSFGSIHSSESRPCLEERSEFSTANRFSRYMNPNKASTAGLTSMFGLDSPSYSLRGSFSTAPRRLERTSVSPGPCAYDVQADDLGRPGNISPRATMGTAPRPVGALSEKSDGVLSEVCNSRPVSRVKGGVIGTAPRWSDQAWRCAPGPTTYRPRQAYLSTYKK
mmetsp:Transcript_18918/g.52085  ORF Transcript_18918/g.52085 Transcript_18918/m.52085 type:complete len:381 (+) Transcript_18918:81-1223(+)